MTNTITPVWTTKEGTEIPMSEMTTSHIINCARMLERNARQGFEAVISTGWETFNDYETYEHYTLYGDEYLHETCYYELIEELKKRNQFPLPTNDK